ncbi:LytTR family DNA-binding domain-containing protein [Cognatishimia activa]|nr:LytTR family DNA-binding domain-containing protein [Cognatishimia activa]
MIETFKDTYKTLFSKLTLSIWVVATLLTVLSGPFGTFEEMTSVQLAIYWTSVTTSSILLGYLAYALTRCTLGFEETTLSRMMAGTLGTFFIATDVFALSHWVYDFADGPSYLSLLGWVGFVFFSVILGRFMFSQAIEKNAQENRSSPIQIVVPTPSETSPEPRLFQRLPSGAHGRVYRLSANDHFVHVRTETGEHKIRMRLRDAILEMDGVDGVCVHRSHWVPLDVMVSVRKASGKISVVLNNGEVVPVSRKYRENVDAQKLPECSSDVGSAAKVQSEASAL